VAWSGPFVLQSFEPLTVQVDDCSFHRDCVQYFGIGIIDPILKYYRHI